MARHVSSDADAPPPPKRRTPSPPAAATTGATVTQVRADPIAVAAQAARVPAAPAAPARPAAPAPSRAQPAVRAPKSPAPRRAVPWWARVVCWAVAIPLGMVVVAWPAWHYEIVDRQKLIDVIAQDGLQRFLPLFGVAAVWAFVTALIVHGLLTLFAHWRRGKATPSAQVGAVTSDPSAPPPPRRPSNPKSAQRRGRNGVRTGS